MHEKFLCDKPVEAFFGEGVSAKQFNDDALGRCLEEIYRYDPTKLFCEIMFEIAQKQKLIGKTIHVDTTTLGVYGDYDQKEGDKTPAPNYGYSKNNRFDLKQMTLGLATTGASGLPIFMESHSGNASDKKTLLTMSERIKSYCKNLIDADNLVIVADSALYDSCINHNPAFKWLTRVPNTHKKAKEWIQTASSELEWQPLENGYSFVSKQVNQKSIGQRWAMIYSPQAYEKEVETLGRTIKKEYEKVKAELWHLGNTKFQCEYDAKKALKQIAKKVKYHKIEDSIKPVHGYEKAGKPSINNPPIVKYYRVGSTLLLDEDKVDQARRTKGRFILATNELDTAKLPDRSLLSVYKEQGKTERGFQFIKDNTFQVDSIFLKKPERICGLMMVMTLCLVVYSFAQHCIREKLMQNNETVLNQVKKPTQKPTMRWISHVLQGIDVVKISTPDSQINTVSKLSAEQRRIISYFGPHAQALYGLHPQKTTR